MPTFDDPASHAEQAHQAVRGLAHALRSMDKADQAYDVIASLRLMLASLDYVLDQLGRFHATTARGQASLNGDRPLGQAAAQHVGDELRYASRLAHRTYEALNNAQNADSKITYRADAQRLRPDAPQPPSHDHGPIL